VPAVPTGPTVPTVPTVPFVPTVWETGGAGVRFLIREGIHPLYYCILPSTQLQYNIMLMQHVSTYNSHLQAKLRTANFYWVVVCIWVPIWLTVFLLWFFSEYKVT